MTTTTTTEAPLSSLQPLPNSDALRARYVGQPITALPTPSVLLDRARLLANCERMLQTAEHWQCRFRAHIKTLKTAQSTEAQVAQSHDKAIIVSTLAEAWGVLNEGLVKQGVVKDILYGVPLAPHKVAELLQLRTAVRAQAAQADVKVLVDSVEQVDALQTALREADANTSSQPPSLNVFIKVDCGYMRAGLTVESPVLPSVIETLAKASSHIRIYGLYAHAGLSYGSRTANEAASFLSMEMQSVIRAAQVVRQITASIPNALTRTPLVLSVGSTPTAHAAVTTGTADVQRIRDELDGDELELHAGNYPVLDLQQIATNAIPHPDGVPAIERCALSVLSTVVSSYPARAAMHGNAQPTHADGSAHAGDEALCDASGMALSKDTGPFPGFGHVAWPASHVGWQVGRVAQEHGILTLRPGTAQQWLTEWGYDENAAAAAAVAATPGPASARIGDKIRIVPQHACMTAAAHAWFFVYDSSLSTDASTVPTVVDVWVPWKGW